MNQVVHGGYGLVFEGSVTGFEKNCSVFFGVDLGVPTPKVVGKSAVALCTRRGAEPNHMKLATLTYCSPTFSSCQCCIQYQSDAYCFDAVSLPTYG